MKKLFFLLFTLTVSYPTLALEFSFVYNDTISSTGIPGLNAGDAAAITVTLDNGGTSLNSQEWAVTDVQSVKFDFGNGALETTFTTPFGGGLSDDNGDNFITDASGSLTAVMGSWGDFNVGTDFTTTGADPESWYLDSFGLVYSDTSGSTVSLNASNGGIPNAANWSPVAATAIPEPSLVLPLLFAVALLWWRSRRTPAVSAAVYA